MFYGNTIKRSFAVYTARAQAILLSSRILEKHPCNKIIKYYLTRKHARHSQTGNNDGFLQSSKVPILPWVKVGMCRLMPRQTTVSGSEYYKKYEIWRGKQRWFIFVMMALSIMYLCAWDFCCAQLPFDNASGEKRGGLFSIQRFTALYLNKPWLTHSINSYCVLIHQSYTNETKNKPTAGPRLTKSWYRAQLICD